MATRITNTQEMRSLWIPFAGLVGLSLGALLLAATGFLVYWQHASNSEHDIAARGGILLFVLSPWILLVAAIVVTAIAAALLRPSGLTWLRIIVVTLAAFAVAACVEFLPPLLLMPRLLALVPANLRPAVDFSLAGLLLLAGSTLVRRAAMPEPPNGR